MSAIGAMRHRLVIENPVDTVDDIGGVARTFVAGSVVWASITPLRATTRHVAARPEAVVTHAIEFRARDLDVDARLRKGARLFRVLAIEDADATGRWKRALCEEIQS